MGKGAKPGLLDEAIASLTQNAASGLYSLTTSTCVILGLDPRIQAAISE